MTMPVGAPFIATFAAIFLAELGDKTQLLTLAFSTRFRPWIVIIAVSAATALLMGIAVLFGGAISYFIPQFWLQLAAGLLFIGFGLWILFGGEEDEGEAAGSSGNPFMIVFSSFFVAELGDKTQLAAFGLAARYGDPFSVWLGATLGMLLVNALVALTGAWISKMVPASAIKLLSASVFVIFGVITLMGLFG